MSLQLEAADSAPYMKPRALILDLFGDDLRYRGGAVKAGNLVSLLGFFGIEPATVRVTLSRLRREHWFTTHRIGRETVYTLTDHMIATLDEGRARIFADYNEPWNERWTTVVHQSGLERLTRDQVRKQLSWLGFGQLSGTAWISPRDRSGEARALAAEFPDVELTVMSSTTGEIDEDRRLAARCWDLAMINDRYADFLAAHQHLLTEAGQLTGVDALIARISLISSYRHFPFIDPWLPDQLRPDGWLGARANALFRTAHDALEGQAQAFVATVVDREDLSATRAAVAGPGATPPGVNRL